SARDVARLLCRSEQTICKWIRLGKFPVPTHQRTGYTRLYYTHADIPDLARIANEIHCKFRPPVSRVKPEGCLTVADVARMAKRQPTTVFAWIRDGRFPKPEHEYMGHKFYKGEQAQEAISILKTFPKRKRRGKK